jgi:hypothetical protein
MLAGLSPGWRLLVLESPAAMPSRAHLIQDGHRLVSVSWEMTALPSDPSRIRRLADEMMAAAREHTQAQNAQRKLSDWKDDGDDSGWNVDDTVAPSSAEPDPDERAIVLRWLAQMGARIEVARVPPDTTGA